MEAFGHLRMYFDGTDSSADKRFKRTSLEELRHIHNSQRIAQIRLVTAELQHCLFVTDDGERCLGDPAAFGSKLYKGIMQYFLAYLEDILLSHEAHLEIQLIELSGRSVCSGILITEAGGNLEIFIKTGSHEQLLILLRCLGQRIEFSFKFSTGNNIVSGALGRRSTQDRGLDLQKSHVRHLLTQITDHLGTKYNVVLYFCISKVKITIF